jgi:hypothetical protein
MSTIKAKSLLDEKNDGGSVLAGGTNTGLNTVDLGSPDVDAMKPVDGANTDKALAGGTFAYDSVGNEIVAKKVSTTLSGTANSVLLSGAAQPGQRKAVNKIEGLTTSKVTSAIRAGEYNIVTGEFGGGYPQSSVDSFGTDDAVTSNELQYMYGNPVPASGAYGSDNATSLV